MTHTNTQTPYRMAGPRKSTPILSSFPNRHNRHRDPRKVTRIVKVSPADSLLFTLVHTRILLERAISRTVAMGGAVIPARLRAQRAGTYNCARRRLAHIKELP